MKKSAYYRLNTEPEIISSFRRTLGQIEWLLLVLILFYLVVGNVDNQAKQYIILASCLYAAVVMAFQYWDFFKEAKQWKIAFQTWVMIILISWIIWYSGKLQSPLFNLYLLPVLASAITLSKITTMLEVGLIFSIFLYLVNVFYPNDPSSLLTMLSSSDLLMLFFPMLLVAYISTMLASDIQNGFNTLKCISEIDELTQLFNHRTFKSIAEKMLQQAKRKNRHISILMIDADNLKKTNDRLGHEAGNLLLANIAQCLISELRSGDVAARYGGDEFIALLPDCEADVGIEVANRILDEFYKSNVRYRGQTIGLSASIGVANFPEHGNTLDEVINNADKAMYYSKHHGRNISTLYSDQLDI